MARLSFYIVDVFAETKYAGNQLAVFTDAAELEAAEMQRIAQEINFSETTFVVGGESGDRGYDVRIFTPAKELPFAGHPTLGTAFVLQQFVIRAAVETIVLNLPVGPIPVTLHYVNQMPNLLWMQQNLPVFGATVPPAAVAPVLNLELSDLDPRFPIQEVSTGVPFLLVPLTTLAALQKIRVDVDRFYRLVEPLPAKEIFVFCPEARHPANQFSARMFAPLLGIAEDPATGSANGCLAAYLVQHRYLGEPSVNVQVEQGYELGRPSLLRLQAARQDEKIQVSVGGNVILVAKGEFV